MKRIGWLMALILVAGQVRGDDWPQWLGPQRDGIWRETGIVEKLPEGGPKVLWRTPVELGYAGPAVAHGKVYVPDFLPEREVTFAKDNNPGRATELKGKERILCLDAKTGKEIWKHEYDCYYKVSYPGGPRCTPTVHDGKVYTLGSMGHFYCLDAEKGTVIWSKDFVKDYGATVPHWGFCGHPLVEGDRVYCIVGGENATAVAFDRNTGKEIWKALNARHPGYSAPEMIEAGGKRQLLIWDGFNLNALNPDNGELYWSVDAAPATQMSIMVPRKAGEFLYASGRGPKGVMVKLASDKPSASEVWKPTPKTGISPINMTPFIDGDTMYGVDQDGKMTAAEVETGKRLWQTTEPVSGASPAPSGTAFLVKHNGRFFIFNEMGELIIARLTPKEYQEISRAKVIEPTNVSFGNRKVVWTHPAFAGKCAFIRNDKEIVCLSLAAE